jgi:hypothetical protein
MPKVQADYSKTIIYKLCCDDTLITDIYIGHTTNFIQRKNQHKNCCNNINFNSYVYQFIREHGGWANWSMIQIEEQNCKNKREAESIEHYWTEQLHSTLNSNKPYAMCTEDPQLYKHCWYEEKKDCILEKKKEHYQENKDTILQKIKHYNEDNKEKIADYQKQYNEDNKEKISEQKKIYREEHKEEAKIKNKEWRTKNEDKLKQQKGQIFNCECGNQYTFGNTYRHFQTICHKLYYDNLSKEPISEEEQKLIDEKNIILEESKKIKIKEQQKIYRQTHTEQIQNYKKQHYETHKNEILEQQKQYHEAHKYEISEQQKIYVEKNKDKIKENKNEWYQKNKETILQKHKEIMICECGSEIRKSGKIGHCNSKKHKDYLLTL